MVANDVASSPTVNRTQQSSSILRSPSLTSHALPHNNANELDRMGYALLLLVTWLRKPTNTHIEDITASHSPETSHILGDPLPQLIEVRLIHWPHIPQHGQRCLRMLHGEFDPASLLFLFSLVKYIRLSPVI